MIRRSAVVMKCRVWIVLAPKVQCGSPAAGSLSSPLAPWVFVVKKSLSHNIIQLATTLPSISLSSLASQTRSFFLFPSLFLLLYSRLPSFARSACQPRPARDPPFTLRTLSYWSTTQPIARQSDTLIGRSLRWNVSHMQIRIWLSASHWLKKELINIEHDTESGAWLYVGSRDIWSHCDVEAAALLCYNRYYIYCGVWFITGQINKTQWQCDINPHISWTQKQKLKCNTICGHVKKRGRHKNTRIAFSTLKTDEF